jgi:uncharacterized protein (TIGR02646 family)
VIFVRRGPSPPSLDLTDPRSRARKELDDARRYLEEHATPPDTKLYKVYSSDSAQEALRDLFHNKCAYCESQVAGSSQTDIEHYRPKGGVSGNPGHPGYWWLAMDWTNLVLSCMHCNQSRRQLNLSPDLTEEEIRQAIVDNNLQTTGKLDAFPTEDGLWATDHEVGVAGERPLLLDPTVTDPEQLFDWLDRIDFALVSARGGDARAKMTIDTLGLNRRRLCEERMTRLTLLSLIMNDIRTGLEEFDRAQTNGEAALIVRAIERDLAKIEAMGDARQPHAALARDFLVRARAAVDAALTV